MKAILNILLLGIMLISIATALLLSIHWLRGDLPQPALISLFSAIAATAAAGLMVLDSRRRK